jgi:hypothetical protein
MHIYEKNSLCFVDITSLLLTFFFQAKPSSLAKITTQFFLMKR